MVKYFLQMGIGLWTFSLYAVALPEFAKKPIQWLSEQSLDTLSFQKSVPYRVAFVKSDDGHRIMLAASAKPLQALSYLSVVDAKSATFSYLLNPTFIHGSLHIYSLSERWEELSALLGANTVVSTYEGKDWVILGVEKGSVVQQTFSPPATQEPQPLFQWLRQSLGYNGVIVAIRDGYYLVASYQDILQKKPQGLVLDNSSDFFFMKEKNKKGDALIQAVSVEGNVAVFQSVLQAQGAAFQVGDKVILSE